MLPLPFDQFPLAALMLIVVGGGMRLFYGAWPWEAKKTWYCTRQAVEYVEALRGKTRGERTPAAIEVVGDAIDTNTDSFDRDRMVYDNLPREMTPQTPAVEDEPADLQSSTEKQLIVRRRWLKSSKQPLQIAEICSAYPTETFLGQQNLSSNGTLGIGQSR